MDKRFKPLSLPQQLALRQQAVEDALAHPELPLALQIRNIRTTLRLTAPEFARLAKVSVRTLRDIESGRSAGTIQTVESLLSCVGLQLGVQRKGPAPR